MTKQDLFNDQAPAFNFELDADQLLNLALEKGVVIGLDGEYEYSEKWLNNN